MATTDDEAIALCLLLGVVIDQPGGRYWRYKIGPFEPAGIYKRENAPNGWGGAYDEPHLAAREWLERHGYAEEAKRIEWDKITQTVR